MYRAITGIGITGIYLGIVVVVVVGGGGAAVAFADFVAIVITQAP